MSEYGEDKKQICFDSLPKLHADLKIRLHNDDIKIKEFFNEIIKAYVERNQNIINFIEELKEKKKISKNIRNKSAKGRNTRTQTIGQFGLDENEIEDIFDIIKKEHPDL
jgi:phosphopantetheine adenylyltransferase